MNRTVLAALIGTSALVGGGAHAQSGRPMPGYDGGQTPPPSDQGGYDDGYGSADARQDNGGGYPPTYRRAPVPPEYGQAPADGYPDDAHRQDQARTADLNRNGYSGYTGSYGDQQAAYRQQMDQHRRDMRDYHDARVRYAERIARWRARADACEAGNINACEGPD